jgi:GAF domain-containing protein
VTVNIVNIRRRQRSCRAITNPLNPRRNCRNQRRQPRGQGNVPELAAESIAFGDDDRLRAILREICDATGMGFAAVARVTDRRWIACQVEDRVDFGLDPGGELKVKETICDEIRDSGEAIVFDDASKDIKWSRHPVPVLYGFRSYCSFPVYLADGTFFGTLCAIDPQPRQVADETIVAMFTTFARQVGEILSEAMLGTSPDLSVGMDSAR